jgi:5-methylcytosine-specific restriction endonuclease McrA
MAAVGLDIVYRQNEDGSYDFSEPLSMCPAKWTDWIKLPIRSFDDVIHSAKLTLRAPTVVVAINYSQMPKKTARAGKKAIYERDKGICQYTGKKLSYNAGTLDHIKPKSKGGKDTFENLVLCDPQVNHRKGNKSNKEAGLKLLRQPKAPLSVTVGSLIVDARHRDWNFFLLNRKKT